MAQQRKNVRNEEGIAQYTKYWQSDSAKDTAEHSANRLDQYKDVVNAYYDLSLIHI